MKKINCILLGCGLLSLSLFAYPPVEEDFNHGYGYDEPGADGNVCTRHDFVPQVHDYPGGKFKGEIFHGEDTHFYPPSALCGGSCRYHENRPHATKTKCFTTVETYDVRNTVSGKMQTIRIEKSNCAATRIVIDETVFEELQRK